MNRIAGVVWSLAFTTLASASGSGCAQQMPPLISPHEAQDRIYDHLSRAEAFRVSRNLKLAGIERDKARKYRELIKEGKTTTPGQALAAAAEHRRRAQSLRSRGYTRFVGRELEAAVKYEEFARRAGGHHPAHNRRKSPVRQSGHTVTLRVTAQAPVSPAPVFLDGLP